MARYGNDLNRLNEARQKIVALDQANQCVAIQKRDDWVKQYHKIAKVALKRKPELLEKIGIRVLFSHTPAQQKMVKFSPEGAKSAGG